MTRSNRPQAANPTHTATKAQMEQKPRHLSEIAAEIKRDWKTPNFAAKPYLSAMAELGEPSESFGADSAKSTILHFLANASSWRGETARKIKAELKSMTNQGAF